MRLRPCGDAALLVELDDLAQVMTLHAALSASRRDGSAPSSVTALVPAARTILVRFAPSPANEDTVAAWVRTGPTDVSRPAGGVGVAREPGPAVELRVVYDGPDVDEVGERTGLGREGVVAAHTARPWTVAFLGFAPGFAYCAGGDPRLRVPRRATPRAVVPAGAVGLAAGFTAVYPRSSPGGWQLIGRTDAAVWDLRRQPPALLTPGTLVQFRAT